jgi:hypothetical protein
MAQVAGYDFALDKAQAGQKFDIRPDVVQSFSAEVAIEPGQPVRRGTNPETQVLVGNATAFLGVALFTHASEQALAGGAEYAIGDTVSVLTQGAVWVTSSVASVVAGTTAYVTAAGAWTNIEGSNLAVGTFLTGGGSGDVVAVELA